MPDQSMKINKVRLSDAGVYICKAGNEHGEVTAPVEIKVKSLFSFFLFIHLIVYCFIYICHIQLIL